MVEASGGVGGCGWRERSWGLRWPEGTCVDGRSGGSLRGGEGRRYPVWTVEGKDGCRDLHGGDGKGRAHQQKLRKLIGLASPRVVLNWLFQLLLF
jgi:hypothetical protein